MDDIVITADQLPAFVTVPANYTVDFLDPNGGLYGHMDCPRDFETKPLLTVEAAPYCPITVKFTAHDALIASLHSHLDGTGAKEAK